MINLPKSLLAESDALDLESDVQSFLGGLHKQVGQTLGGLLPTPKPPEPSTLTGLSSGGSIVAEPTGGATPVAAPAPFELPDLGPRPLDVASGGPATADRGPTPAEPPPFELPDLGPRPAQLAARPITGRETVPTGAPAPVLRGPTGTTPVAPDAPVTRETVTQAAATALERAGLPTAMAPYISAIAINEGILQPGTIARDYWSVGGVKAPPGSAGTVTVPTREVINGQSVMQQGTFGRFNSMQEGMDSLATFIRDSPRFGPVAQRAAQTGDYAGMIEGMRQQGYATDPNWTRQVTSIASSLPVPSAPSPAASAAAPVASAAAAVAPSARGGFDPQAIVQQWQGIPYVFGGAGGRGQGISATDCSGFISALTGLPAHTDAAYQALIDRGAAKISPDQAQPGDVVFYMGGGTGGTFTHHMGMVAGPGKVLDMSTASGGGVQIRDIGHGGRYEILRDPANPQTPPVPQNARPPTQIVPTGYENGGDPVQGISVQDATVKAQAMRPAQAFRDLAQSFDAAAERAVPIGTAALASGPVAAGPLAFLDDTRSDIRGQSGAQILPPSDQPDALSANVPTGTTSGPVRDDYRLGDPQAGGLVTSSPSGGVVESAVPSSPAPAPPPTDPWHRVGEALRDAITGVQGAAGGVASAVGGVLTPDRSGFDQAAADIQARSTPTYVVPDDTSSVGLPPLPQPEPTLFGGVQPVQRQPSPTPSVSSTEGVPRDIRGDYAPVGTPQAPVIQRSPSEQAPAFTRALEAQQSGVDITPVIPAPGELAQNVVSALAPVPDREIERASRGEAVNPLAYGNDLGYRIADTLPDELKGIRVRLGPLDVTGRDFAALLFDPTNLPAGPIDQAGTLVLGAVGGALGVAGGRALAQRLARAGHAGLATMVARQADDAAQAAAPGIRRIDVPTDWWSQTYGGRPKMAAEAGRIEEPLEKLLAASARSSPDGLAHLGPDELRPFAVPTTQKGELRPFIGDAIPNPTPIDDVRRARDIGTDVMGAHHWYQEYPTDLEQSFGRQNLNEAQTLFTSYSAVLDPLKAKQLTYATMATARQTDGFAGMSQDQIKDTVMDYVKAHNDGKGFLTLPVHFQNVDGIYAAGERSIAKPKLSNFGSDFLSGRLGYLRDQSSTNDVWMQRGYGYRAWDEAGKQKLAQWAEPYRYGNTITQHLAREVSMSPEEAQAAIWTTVSTAALPNNAQSFAWARYLNRDQAEAFKAATPVWKQVAKDLRDQKITLGQAIDQLEPLGVFRFRTPGAIDSVNEHPLTQRLAQAFDAGGFAQQPMPGPMGRITGGLFHPGGPSTPWTAIGSRTLGTSPLDIRAGEAAPTLALAQGEPGSSFFLHDLRYPHRVAIHDNQPGMTVAFPNLNHTQVGGVAQRLADESGATVHVVRAPSEGETANAMLFTVPRTSIPGRTMDFVQSLQSAFGTDIAVQYDGQIVRVLAPESQAEGAADRLLQIGGQHGIPADAVTVRGRYVDTIGPATGAAPGDAVGAARPGGGRATDHYRRALEGEFGRTIAPGSPGTPGAPGSALTSILPGDLANIPTGARGAALQATATGLGAGYEESQQEGATPQSVIGAGLGAAGQSLLTSGARRIAGIRPTTTVLAAARRAGQEVNPEDITHVRGFGYLKGVNQDARDVLERVAERGRQYPEGVSWDDMDDVIKQNIPDPDAVAAKWGKANTAELAGEMEVLRRGAASSLDDFMGNVRRITDLNDSSPDVIMGAADRLVDAAVANEWLMGTRRAAESVARALNMFKNQINAQQARALFESLDRSGRNIDQVQGVLNGTLKGPRAGQVLDQAAASIDALGKQSDSADRVLERLGVTDEQARNLREVATGPAREATQREGPYVDPLVQQMKVREDMKRTLDRALEQALQRERDITTRTEVEDFARQARETMGQIIQNTNDPALRDDLAETLGRMREHSNTGELAADRLQQTFDQRLDTWASTFMKGVEGRNAAAAKAAQTALDREALAGHAEKLREMAQLARDGRDPRLLEGIDDLRIAMDQYGKMGRERSYAVKQAITKQGLQRFAGKLDDGQIAQFTALLRTVDPDRPETLGRLMRAMTKGTLTDHVIEYAVANMLSSPATQFINTSSGVLQGLAALGIKHPLMVVMDPVINRGNRQVFASEIPASAQGIAAAFTSGLQAAGETMRYGYSKASVERAAQLGDFGGVRRELLTEKFGPWGAALHAISTRPMQAMDELIGGMLYSANLYTLAERRAQQSGGKLTREAILNDLPSHLDLVHRAGEMADYSMLKSRDRVTAAIGALNRAGQGKGAGAESAAEMATYASHVLFPFVRTPWNVLKQGVEFSPLGTAVNVGRLGKAAVTGADPLRTTELAANVASGVGLATLGAVLWSGGNISGDGPTDLGKRRELEGEGWLPRAIRVNGQWISYDSTPFTIPLGSLVTGLERYQEAVDKGQTKASPNAMWEGVMGFGIGTASSFANQSFVKNAADLYSGVREGNFSPESFGANLVSRYIPAGSMVAYLSRLGDSVQRETRVVEHPGLAQLQERTPLRGGLTPRQDVLGRAMPNPQSAVRDIGAGISNILLPAPRRSDVRESPVISAFQSAGIDLPESPPKQITVDTVPIELSPTERQSYQRAYGDAVQRKLAVQTGWNQMTPNAQRDTLERIKRESSAAAVERVKSEIGTDELIRRKRAVPVRQ